MAATEITTTEIIAAATEDGRAAYHLGAEMGDALADYVSANVLATPEYGSPKYAAAFAAAWDAADAAARGIAP